MSKPNVVLILVDQMRKDCIGVLKEQNIETPHLDMMKKSGYLFKNAYSAVPSCIASRAAVMTGLTQKSHRYTGYQADAPWEYKTTMAGAFTDAGYHTQCVGKMHASPERYLCGFHNIVLHDGYLHNTSGYGNKASVAFTGTDDYLLWLKRQLGVDKTLIDNGLECNSWVARPWPHDEYYHPTNWVVHESIDFLRRRDPSKPFFLTMSFVRPHSPLDPPQYYYDMYKDQDITQPHIGDWAAKDDPEGNALDISTTNGRLPRETIRKARAAYFGLITHIDHQIGRFMQAVKEYRLMENTIFLFASDHGDLLGDHNLFRKALPYEGSAGIPFIIYDPGKLLGNSQNRFIDAGPVELRDIFPTLAEAAGIPIPECVEGKSIIPLINDPDAEWRPYLHGEHAYGEMSNHYVTDGKYKYIWFSQTGRDQFFDLLKDRNELDNLICNPNYEEKISIFKEHLISELEGREEGYVENGKLIAGKKAKSFLNYSL